MDELAEAMESRYLDGLRWLPRDTVGLVSGELIVRITTSNAPKVARRLCEQGVKHACVLRGVKDHAYKLHHYFYEGGPGAAGFEDDGEVRRAVKRVLDAVGRVVGATGA